MPSYRIAVRGPLPDGLLAELGARWDGVRLGPRAATPELLCDLPDEAALRGLLTTLWDAGLDLSAVERGSSE
jgi:hypothetical protein